MKVEWTKELKDIVASYDLTLPGGADTFIHAMAIAESGMNTRALFHEPLPLDMNSCGLLQLSLTDVANYKAQHLNITTEDHLFIPEKNIALGCLILKALIAKHPKENIWQAGGRYWSVLRPKVYWRGKEQRGYNRFVAAMRELGSKEKLP